jgi:hypothetical protein
MKKYIKLGLLLSALITTSQADIQLTLIDKDGNQNSQCIKSYSFSNNLESMAKQKGSVQDVYSTSETLTNKTFMGKPVYRKVIQFGDKSSLANNSNVWHKLYFNINNLDTQLSVTKFGNNNDYSEYASSNSAQFREAVFPDYYSFACSISNMSALSDLNFVVEYTKTTDLVNETAQTSFKSYLHYIPSSSSTDEVTTVDLKETGVRFLTGYNYDETTDSCTVSN